MLIPDNIENFESRGEHLLYMKFKHDGSTKNMYVLHSLFTNHHLKNISGELDFLVMVPGEGIFAIEVKHGKVFRKNGKWNFQNRLGSITTKTKGPFAQVDGTMNSIRKFILKKVSHKKDLYDRFSKILWGTGVAFTSMNEFIDVGVEAHPWQILTRRGLDLKIGYYIDALSKGWHNENKGKYWYDVNLSRPTDSDCKMLLQILRGDFEINYLEINRITDNEHIIEEFTREQFKLLDFVEFNERCLIEGAAGTGKTLMAIELLRKEVSEGKKVGLFCYNKKLGKKLTNSAELISEDKPGSFVARAFHKFLMNGVDLTPPKSETDLHQFYSEELPLEFLIQNDGILEKDKFDVLILDEAQDLISPYFLEIFDFMLKGGIRNGKWVFFGDFSRQAIYLNDSEEIYSMLQQKTGFTRFPPLKINCRNTRKIASQNTLLTGSLLPEFTSRSLEGDTIVSKFPAKNGQKKEVENILRELEQKNIPLSKVTLLSPKRYVNTFLGDSTFISNCSQKGMHISTIQAYKGLENTVVILYDFDEISSADSQKLLYVGISRARQKLYLVLNKSLENSYKELVSSNLNKL